ncbi:MAG TPA: T9SS type A sorting domain-containing protein [Bacteroidetes bacterium]|nr:T9SS type A sorting domain-containing protein [Bacteroidota bacterium]
MVRIYADGFAVWTDVGIEINEDEVTEIEAILTGTGVQVSPATVNTVLAPDDTLNVQFNVLNPDEETYEVDVLLQPAGGTDWDADLQITLSDILGTIEARGVAVVESTVVVCGSRPGEGHMVWRLAMDGELIDSLAQPERFTEGALDLATTGDGHIIAGSGDMLFTLDADWNIIDSLQTSVDNIHCVAFDEEHGLYYLSGPGLEMYAVDLLGNTTDTYELPITPTGLAFNPDDRYGPAVYSLELAGAGLAQLSRINLETGEVSTIVDLAPDGFDIASAIDIEGESAKPFQRVVVLQLGSGVRLFNRDVQHRAYDVTDTFTLPPGGADVSFSLYGPRLIPGSIVEMELVFDDRDGLWSRTVPITIEPINYVVGGDDENALPSENELLPPYPNPFNATVQIGYRLAEPAEVKLAVFNVLGREIAVLDQGRKAAGTYRVAWDARDMATGVYVAVLRANGERVATKMLLVR